MKVLLLGRTQFDAAAAFEETGWTVDDDTDPTSGQGLAEFAGRACYQSWTKPNPATATNAGYLKHILEVGHLSVLEHGTVTFYITDVSRSLTHELIRHRHFSYSQLSQRYVPAVSSAVEPDIIAADPDLHEQFMEAMQHAHDAYTLLLAGLDKKLADRQGDQGSLWADCNDGTCPEKHLRDPDGVRRHQLPDDHPTVKQLRASARTKRNKQVRQAARSVLPNAAETRIVVTGNYRAWRHFIAMRATEAADVEIRALAVECLRHLREVAGNVFADFELRTLDDGTVVAESSFTHES